MKIFAHQGFSKRYPGNTLASFQGALGISDGIECDLWMTRDGRWVVFHNNYHRDAGFVTEISYHQLRHYHSSVCLLTELLDLISNKIPVFLEIKGKITQAQVNDLLAILYRYPTLQYYLGGFCSQNIKYLHQFIPSSRLVYNIVDSTPGNIHSVPADILSISKEQLDSEFVRNHPDKTIWVYTVNDKFNYQRCLQLGVDVIITDDPTLSFVTPKSTLAKWHHGGIVLLSLVGIICIFQAIGSLLSRRRSKNL